MGDGVNPQTSEREQGSGEERSGSTSRTDASGGQSESVDLANKDQPAEGGRDQAEEGEERG